jgi:hypothetical protein
MLNDIETYCQTWGLKINTEKTKILIFEKGRHTHYNFTLCGKDLDNTDSFKYLGTHIYKNGSWCRTQKRIAQHANFALHNLFIAFNQLELSFESKFQLFDSLVGSVLNYNAAVWGNYESREIEQLHCKFLRKILHVKKSANLEALYGETGRYPMKIARQLKMIQYWFKIIKTKNASLYYTYKMLMEDANREKTYNGMNWAYQIKTILNNIGFTEFWINQQTLNNEYPIIKQRILDIYNQTWYTKINNSPKLSTYCLFKHQLTTEKYLTCIQEKKFRIALTRFRISAHDLRIETGRYTNTDRQNRICSYCHMNTVENEYHFLLTCPKYRDIRKRFLPNSIYTWPNINKFTSIMSSSSNKIINNISKFIYYANKTRS